MGRLLFFEPRMKKLFISFWLLLAVSFSFAETVQLKDGSFVSGSITSQTEYTINITTSYGPVVLSQREVQAILPDKHRVHLKGGTQLIGIITDLDEFNLKLQTDEGIVNIDMPQIVSVEVYDYEQGDNAQKNIAQRQAAQQEQENKIAAQQAAGATAATAAGGLSFDSDIEKVFDAKKADVVNGQVQTVQEISAAQIRAQQAALSDEEAFLKGVPKEKSITQNAEAARSGKLEKTKKAEAKKAQRPKENTTNKLFALSVGAHTNNLKLDNSKRSGFAGTDPYDVGGTSVRVEGSFLWRIKSSNLWVGPTLALANLSKNSFLDLDPAIGPSPDTTDVTTSGQIMDFLAKANYYFNPDSLFTVYATASAGYRLLTLNYHGVIRGENIDSSSPVVSAGLGIQVYLDDVLVGLEVTEHFSAYSKEFKNSSNTSTVASVTFTWKF